MKYRLLIWTALLLASPCSAWAQLPHATPNEVGMQADFGADIERQVAIALEEKKMPGCVVLVARQGKIVFEKAFGNRRITPTVEAMTTDTLFDMASITKPIATATSIMQLIQRGDVRLNEKVSTYLPEFKGHGKENVTVEQLMIHVGGLTPDNALADYKNGWPEAYEKICDLKLLSPAGDKFRYSDVGFLVLGEIVARVSGKPLDQYAKESIFEPLGMQQSGYNPSPELCEKAVTTEEVDGQWLKGTVHDPRARAMGGVAGHAGLFSTADDIAIYAQAMLDARIGGENTVLNPQTLARMTSPHDAVGNNRGLGWDKQSVYSRNRGDLMTPAAYGHGGFTGTALWIDPGLDLIVLFLSNRVHPNGKGSVNDLAGKIGTIASGACLPKAQTSPALSTKLGIDVLADSKFAALKGQKVGVIGNHTSRTKSGESIVELMANSPDVELVTIFSPEHGFFGALDQSEIGDTVDPKTGVAVKSLYGKTRKPTPEMLKGIDRLVFDIQDVGCRFYTYISTMGLAMEAAAENNIKFVVLDRPNPINGVTMEGPMLDDAKESFVAFHALPIRHGMTIGEIAQLLNAEKKLGADLTVVKMANWRRDAMLFDTGLPWRNTSPNMRSLTEALLYPGVGILETTNISVGRGTDTPFEQIGAPWINGPELAAAIEAYEPPGVRIVPIEFTPTSSKYEGELCNGVNFVITDWETFRPVQLAWSLAAALRKTYPQEWETKRLPTLLGSASVLKQIEAGDSPETITKSYQAGLDEFTQRREAFLLY
ncbi:exo-beta-N-acetylmuramidase NamZ domain-containing protein [Blastopirellula retiformator]|uniref:Esterase EstB n=1 Tax=Blastopirellula retiformator TaxID=2527970 RepID=A0A5C5UUU8_9BACT|nr:exo-beta-N-acetylmuramidase NamZ domain-containing protein [Blastopirellula retiformator]TWT29908.1 Esterase EstB [Blastopirellula retiformator]